MAAELGNKYWQLRTTHGRDKKYSPETLWETFVSYADWVNDNPLIEAVLVPRGMKVENNGKEKLVYKTGMPKMRPLTITGFQLFADISDTTWENYSKEKDFLAVTSRIKNTCWAQKFEGAAAGLLHPNIIARDLGLVDKSSTEVKVEQPLFPDVPADDSNQ